MNNIPPLKGLTAQDRVNWDKSYKDYLLKQGKTEDEIDKYYVAYHFKKNQCSTGYNNYNLKKN